MSMTCLEFRQRVGAEPNCDDAEVLRHRLACSACAAFAAEQARLDAALGRAVRVPVPENLADRIRWKARNAATTWYNRAGMAASLVLALGIGFGVWTASEKPQLASEVVAHVQHEPELLLPTPSRATPQRVSAVMGRGGLHLEGALDEVVHAGLCPFRGRLVPHLVMNVDGEPVSVLLLRDQRAVHAEAINEDGFEGMIVPTEYGAMAIVAGRADLLIPVREQLDRAVSQGI